MSKRLLLWDVDSTLIISGHAGEYALKRVASERFGGDGNIDGVEIAGRTDRGIARQILQKYGAPITEPNITEFLDDYVRQLAIELPHRPGKILPGVLELLTRILEKSHHALGLLTGNMRAGAELKLRHYDLWRFFEFGAFADDHHDRNELGVFARQRAHETTGIAFSPEQIDVIGDTPHDIACGKAIGARTIAVATGSYSPDQLARFEPDFVFQDFSSADDVVAQLGW
jgi:phosphoglycolate phosphatase-like HAD superfamily hydrolase